MTDVTVQDQSITVSVDDGTVTVDFTTGITTLNAATDVTIANLQVDDFLRWNGSNWYNTSVSGAGATQLSELSDVNTSTPTNRNVLVADGVDWESRALVEADISDLQSYALATHTHLMADITDSTWISDITAESFSDLSDVLITAIGLGELLQWNGTSWINRTITEAGIATATHTHVEADITDLQAYLLNITGEPLSDLSDVTITTIAAGEILKWDGAGWINNTLVEAGIAAATHTHVMADITDSTWISGITAEPLSDLSDVTITAIASGELLKWNGAAWVNNTLAEAGIAAATHTHVEADITDLGAYLENVVEDASPQLGGNLNVLTRSIWTSTTNGSISIQPDGTGNVVLGNFTFDGDQTVGVGQDNYVLTYDNASGVISLEAATGGGASALNDLTDVTITTVGNDEVLQFTGTVWENQTLAEAGISAVGHTHTLAGLTDTTITAAAKGDMLVYNGSAWIDLTVGADDQVLTADSAAAAGVSWQASGTGGVTTFVGLSDTPNAYTGAANQFVKVNGTPDALVFTTAQLTDLSDVNTSTATNRNVLVADGVDWESRALVEADISDLGNYSVVGHTHVMADITDSTWISGITAEPLSDLSDVTITAIAAGELLKWSGTAWINNTLAEAGIAAATHTHVEADITDLGNYGEIDQPVTVSGLWTFSNASGLATDDITERTAAAGVTIDSVVMKDGGITAPSNSAIGANATVNDDVLIISDTNMTVDANAGGIDVVVTKTGSPSIGNTLQGIVGTATYAETPTTQTGDVYGLQYNVVWNTASDGTNMYGINVGVITQAAGQPANIIGAAVNATLIGAGASTKAIGIVVDDFGNAANPLTAGIQIQNQSAGTARYGIMLDGDGIGSSIAFGAGEDATVYFDGTDLVFNMVTAGNNIKLGNFEFDVDQAVGAGQDNYVLTYDNALGTIQLEAATGGGASQLNDLTDVTITAAAAGEYLRHNGSVWVDAALSIVDDTTPQLGGNLDVQANQITTSTVNGNIDIQPNGTGDVVLGNFSFDGDQTVGAGQDNYVLTYDNGTGLISLEAAAGGGNVSNTGTPVDNQLAVWTSSTVIEGDAALTFDTTTDTLDCAGIVTVDTVNEHTADTGVTVDGVVLRDNHIALGTAAYSDRRVIYAVETLTDTGAVQYGEAIAITVDGTPVVQSACMGATINLTDTRTPTNTAGAIVYAAQYAATINSTVNRTSLIGLDVLIRNFGTGVPGNAYGLDLSTQITSNWASTAAYGINIADFGHSTTPLAAAINIQPQTGSTTVHGIILGGDNLGSDVVFGAGRDASIYWNGTNLVIDATLVSAGVVAITGAATATAFNGVALTDAGSATQFLAGDGTYQSLVMTDISDSTWISGITAEPLSDLSDVTITSIAANEILKWSGTAWINNTLAEAGIASSTHTHALNDLTDVTITAAATGEYLRYSGTAWVDAALDISDDTTPQLGGTLDCNSNHVDNAKSVTFIAENDVGTGTAINWTTAQKQKASPSGATTYTFTAPNGPANLTLKLVNGSTNNPSWPATVKWAGGTEPTWSTGTDIVSFYYDGTDYYGAANTGFA